MRDGPALMFEVTICDLKTVSAVAGDGLRAGLRMRRTPVTYITEIVDRCVRLPPERNVQLGVRPPRKRSAPSVG